VNETIFLRHIAYDSVIFGFSGEKLKILIMKYYNTGLYALPGGFMQRDENLNDAVRRGLKERTGLENIYLEQFYTFGDVARYKPEIMQTILEANEQNIEPYQWMLDRFISVAYYALINYNDVVPTPDALSDSCDWYDMDELPNLMLDHAEIVAKALQTLREKVYEAILGEKLHRGTFQRKILGLGLLQRHEKQFLGKAHKAPFLYSFGF
jgi:ADP-ribose pyrophosphatase YjhB (NUDIX family)